MFLYFSSVGDTIFNSHHNFNFVIVFHPCATRHSVALATLMSQTWAFCIV